MNNKAINKTINKTKTAVIIFSSLLVMANNSQAKNDPEADPKLTEIWEPIPEKVTVPTIPLDAIPSDAIPLLQNNGADHWQHPDGRTVEWLYESGELTVKPQSGSIVTKQKFCDMQMHLEWRSPKKSERKKNAHKHANSGIKIQGLYEVQILDTYNTPIYVNGQAASIYKQAAPLVDALSPSGEWQSYDIIFNAPRFTDAGKLDKAANITVLHNGVVVQNNFELQGTTLYRGTPKYFQAHGCKPILLQDHGGEISFRNIWVREL